MTFSTKMFTSRDCKTYGPVSDGRLHRKLSDGWLDQISSDSWLHVKLSEIHLDQKLGDGWLYIKLGIDWLDQYLVIVSSM